MTAIHGAILESLARVLSRLTGEEVVVKGQDPAKLKQGLRRWRRWLASQDD